MLETPCPLEQFAQDAGSQLFEELCGMGMHLVRTGLLQFRGTGTATAQPDGGQRNLRARMDIPHRVPQDDGVVR